MHAVTVIYIYVYRKNMFLFIPFKLLIDDTKVCNPYSQLSLRWTPLGQALSVCLREVSVL